LEIILGVLAGLLAIVTVGSVVRLGPGLTIYALASSLTAIASLAVRCRSEGSRVRAIALGVSTASAFLLVGGAIVAMSQHSGSHRSGRTGSQGQLAPGASAGTRDRVRRPRCHAATRRHVMPVGEDGAVRVTPADYFATRGCCR